MTTKTKTKAVVETATKIRRIGRSISFSPGLFAAVERVRGKADRSLVLCEAVWRVLGGRVAYRPNRELVEVSANPKRSRKGPPGKESWSVTRSVSFAPDLLMAIDGHRALLGMERSRYVWACLEHVHGIRPHPELFEASMRP